METIEYILPSHFACPLINSDFSGLSNKEEKALDRFIADCQKEHGDLFYCIDVAEEGSDGDMGFMTHHDLQPYGILSCDCLTFTFQINEK